jgi:hypothetical protein
MPDLIQNIPLDFAQLRSNAAEAAVLSRQLTGEIRDETEARAILQDLLARTQSFAGPIVQHPDFQEYTRISSEAWNSFQESILIDMRTIYDSITTLESASKAMEVIARSDLTQTKAAILKAISQLQVYQFLRQHPEFQDLKIIDFVRSINDSKRRPLAVVDQDIRMLELPAKARQVVSSSRLKGRRTRVYTKMYGGGKLTGFNEAFSPSNIIDSNPNNFWVEVMSTNAPVEFDHETSWGDYHATGVVAEVTLEFSHVERVNNLKLLPFSEFPYNIIDISYKEASSATRWTTIPNFTISYAVEDWVEYDFTYIAVDQLRITIEQPNYTRNVSLVPESVVRKNNLWAQLQASEYDRSVHELDLTTRESGRIAVQPEQLHHLVALERLDKELEGLQLVGERYSEYKDLTSYIDAISNIVDEISPGSGNSVREPTKGERLLEEDKTRQLRSYDYLVGLRNITLSAITYEPISYYESPEFITNGTVVQVQLDSTEIQPVFKEDDGVVQYRKTSIEYEIETSPDTRFPIVPLSDIDGDNYIVRDEWIRLVRNRGRLRFNPISTSISVRRNGTRIPMNDITLDGRDIVIADSDKNAVYTATYHVSEEETKVDIDTILNPTKLLKPEEFDGTDFENKIILKYYPYIVYEIIRDKELWTKDPNNAIYSWTPDFYPLSTGSVSLTTGSTAVVLTKDNVGDPDFLTIPFGTSNTEIKIWIQETNEIIEMDPNPAVPVTATQAYLKDIYTGDSVASSRFIIGRTTSHGNVTYGLNIDNYEPIKVLVNGIRALNKTDYYSRQHPAFVSTEGSETQLEYIQAGKAIFFNGPVDGKITVVYDWLTQYLKLVATLRCNVPIATIFSPKIDQIKIRVKTTEL